MLLENIRRIAAASRKLPDPLVGNPDDPHRIPVHPPWDPSATHYIPLEMLEDPQYPLAKDPVSWQKLRCRHDFEFWCATCCTIKHKTLGMDMKFVLNAPQRRVASMLEADRRAGRPIRLIMLKARQWGGSTLIQTYMAWIQSCHCHNWNSIICSQVKDTSAGIRGMYSKLIENYPQDLWEGDVAPKFKPYERSQSVREIAGRGCRVTISSIENQDAVRGADFAMAHLTETAFWPETPSHSPADLVRAICGSIALVPLTLIVMESTANGVGNYFHREWLRCEAGKGDKRAVFVPWYEIEIYRLKPSSYEELAASLTPYEQMLWDKFGCDLDQINWYRHKLREYPSHEKMMAEFPTTASEAFTATGNNVFGREKVEALRRDCFEPEIGDISEDSATFVPDSAGMLKVWEKPVPGQDYIVAVDVGGRWEKADWSVIAVMRVGQQESDREIVAQWRGHIDHDLLATEAMRIAAYYNEALLVVESNSLESGAGNEMYILNRLSDEYRNLYRRVPGDFALGGEGMRVGFHTNRATKEMLIAGLIRAVREGLYTERDVMACNELDTYEQSPSGGYAAKAGCHDDILMTRALALHLSHLASSPPLIAPLSA